MHNKKETCKLPSEGQVNEAKTKTERDKMKNIFLTVDATNGIQMHNSENCTTKIVDGEVFMTEVRRVTDEQCVGAYVSQKVFDALDAEFGIRKY